MPSCPAAHLSVRGRGHLRLEKVRALLSFLTDSRSGLDRFGEFRVSNYQRTMHLIDHRANHQDVNDILVNDVLALPHQA
ncbi:MAG: hypothetical protein CSA58_11435 [Micrococcales bacterium]|nr:MAG: hypothetical protein CSB46_02955 [Micrococcales bacterium]PIE26065.1 MAG: hypothetical protein CSA58_11435 [Micrococcales bacterium]